MNLRLRIAPLFRASVVFLLVAGCAPKEEGAASPQATDSQSKPPIIRRFQCEKASLVVTFFGDRVELKLPNRSVTLRLADSASGDRYTNGSSTFWDKGGHASLEFEGVNDTCNVVKDPWLDADQRGVLFRAVGQEPGWDLEIDKSAMRLRYDYGEKELKTPAPSPAQSGSTATYEAVSGSRRMRVVIEERSCADAMSGAEFSRAVTVEVDNKTLKGCGRPSGAAVPQPQ